MYEIINRIFSSVSSYLFSGINNSSSSKRIRDEIFTITDDEDDDVIILSSPKKQKLNMSDTDGARSLLKSTVTQTEDSIDKRTMKKKEWQSQLLSTKENWNGVTEVIDLVKETPNKLKNQYRPPQHVCSPHRNRRKPLSSKQRALGTKQLNWVETDAVSVKDENCVYKNWPHKAREKALKLCGANQCDSTNRVLQSSIISESFGRVVYGKLLNSILCNKDPQPLVVREVPRVEKVIDLTEDSSDNNSISDKMDTNTKVYDGKHLQLFEDSGKDMTENSISKRKVKPRRSTFVDISRHKSISPIVSLDDDEDDVQIVKTPPVTRSNSLRDMMKAQTSVCEVDWMLDIVRKYEEKKNELEEMTKMLSMELKIASEVSRSAYNEITLKKISKHLEITEALLDEEDPVELSLPELTPEIMNVINKASKKSPANEVLIEKFNYKIKRSDIHTLLGLNWLNDEIINFYTTLIVERSKVNENLPKTYCFSTFFYLRLESSGYQGVKRWTKKVDLFSHDLIIVPVHLRMHWCLAAIDLKKKTINYYDSMGGGNDQCLKWLEEYMVLEYKDKKGEVLSMDGWTKTNVKEIPHQMNGSDCGVFSCTFAEFLSRRARLSFSQKDMPYIRQKMIYEIVSGKLLT